MKSATIIHDMTPDQISSLFEGLQNQIDEIKKNFQPKQPTEYLILNEVCELLKRDRTTIERWCKQGKLKKHLIGNSVYWRRDELETALKPFS